MEPTLGSLEWTQKIQSPSIIECSGKYYSRLFDPPPDVEFFQTFVIMPSDYSSIKPAQSNLKEKLSKAFSMNYFGRENIMRKHVTLWPFGCWR